MTSEASYEQRINMTVPERTYTLAADGLRWQGEGSNPIVLPHADLESVRLKFAPTRARRNQFLMELRSKKGTRVTLSNIHYKGFASYEERNEAFSDFVEAYHQSLLASGADVTFHSGSTPAAYTANVALSIFFAIVVVAVFLVALMIGVYWLVILELVIMVFYTPTLIKLLKRNKPGTYDPAAIPAELLPR